RVLVQTGPNPTIFTTKAQKNSKQHKNILNRSPLKVSPTPKPTRHVKNTCLRLNCETNTCHHNPTPFPPSKPSGVSPESPWFTCIFHGRALFFGEISSINIDISSRATKPADTGLRNPEPPSRLPSTPYFHSWRASIDLFEISYKKANPTNQNTVTDNPP
ncbi:unnamed protein product, partial [Brassica napus]